LVSILMMLAVRTLLVQFLTTKVVQTALVINEGNKKLDHVYICYYKPKGFYLVNLGSAS
jgi:hypothetical protein